MTSKEYIERRDKALQRVLLDQHTFESRQAIDQLILDIAFAAMESCEPDCDAVRHAIHQGSWDTMNRIEQIVGADEEN